MRNTGWHNARYQQKPNRNVPKPYDDGKYEPPVQHYNMYKPVIDNMPESAQPRMRQLQEDLINSQKEKKPFNMKDIKVVPAVVKTAIATGVDNQFYNTKIDGKQVAIDFASVYATEMFAKDFLDKLWKPYMEDDNNRKMVSEFVGTIGLNYAMTMALGGKRRPLPEQVSMFGTAQFTSGLLGY